VLRHDRRELLHCNVTDHPTAVWTARQILQAFPDETAPSYLLDRDAVYGECFTRCIANMDSLLDQGLGVMKKTLER
jgi:hypothetical protein